MSGGVVREVCGRLGRNEPVRRTLSEGGRLHVDRQLPFLCVFRGDDEVGRKLVTTEASYLVAPGPEARELAVAVARTMGEEFGAFLVVEVWLGKRSKEQQTADARPAVSVRVPKRSDLGRPLDTLIESLGRFADVGVERDVAPHPPRREPLLPPGEARRSRWFTVGLQVRPDFLGGAPGEVFPERLSKLRRGLSRALRQTFFEFARIATTHRPRHYNVLGRRAVVKAVWTVDDALASVADAFDFLLQVTPVNTGEAWHEFKRRKFNRAPVFHYRPLPVDPVILKRKLFEAPLERVEDPALAQLFRRKQDELDRQLTMLRDVDSRRFVYGSLQCYGPVDDRLMRRAQGLLRKIPARSRDGRGDDMVAAEEFAQAARTEIGHYRERAPEMDARVEVRDDIASGLMVVKGSLLIGKDTRVPRSRVDALLQHEVGTHVVTYYNGRAQPFHQLQSGLAGYEPLQEGLAVMAEALVGGLNRARLRLLAARVVAARLLIDGAGFIDTYRALNGDWGFPQQTAFSVTMRTYRGGGLTKDAVYLRGLIELHDHLRNGGELEPLFMGKFGLHDLPLVSELRWRGVLRDAPLKPRYLEREECRARLDRIRKAKNLSELLARGER